MKRLLILLLVTTSLAGCAVIQSTGLSETDPTLTEQRKGVKKEFDTVPPPGSGKPISVAVYAFKDLTGQRKPQPGVASFSTAVTQGPEPFLIKALQDVGQGRWFEVVERVGIDNLVKERTIIKQMRDTYEGPKAKQLAPMQFAGIILEGGVIGYDTTTTSGGAGVRVFGIGKQTQWTQDVVTVSLRAVSVNTGKVLASVTVQKTILSTADSATALKFFDQATQSFEAEVGLTINEPGTYALKSAIEMSVVELIKEGERKGIWDYKVEEKKNELVQPQAKEETAAPRAEPQSTPTKVEDKKEEPTKAVETKKEEKAVEEKTTAVDPEGVKWYVKTGSYVFKTMDPKSQRTWFFEKGTEVSITPAEDDWVLVTRSDKKKGYVKKDVLTLDRPN